MNIDKLTTTVWQPQGHDVTYGFSITALNRTVHSTDNDFRVTTVIHFNFRQRYISYWYKTGSYITVQHSSSLLPTSVTIEALYQCMYKNRNYITYHCS